MELRLSGLLWCNMLTLTGTDLWALDAFKCSWRGMWRTSPHPDKPRMFLETKAPLAGVLSEWRYLICWTMPLAQCSFVGTKAPQDHCFYCQTLSTFFRLLVENLLFTQEHVDDLLYVLRHARPLFTSCDWSLNTDNRIHTFKQNYLPLALLLPSANSFHMQNSDQGMRRN